MRLAAATLLAIAWMGHQALPVAQSPLAAASLATQRSITIDVSVTDARGRPVADLKPGDFDLREGALPLPLESARLVSIAGAPQAETPADIRSDADERSAAGADDARLFAIFLDEYHVGSAESVRVRDTLTRFIDRDVTPRDLVVVMKPLDSLLAIRLTRDRDAARKAIGSFQGRKGDYEPRNAYERDFMAATPARVDIARNQVALSAINALAVHLGSLADRRKTLIVATEYVGPSERHRGQDFLPTIETIIRSANRSNVAVYPFDPRDPVAGDPQVEALRRLAGETDGATIAADADAGLRRVSADSSAYYVLTFRSPHPDDGQFRELETRVTRSGVVVRARKGYWTVSPDEALRTALIAKANEPKVEKPLEPAPHKSPLIQPWFGVSRGEHGNTRVTFVWEPAPRVPGDRVRHSVSRLELEARTTDGAVRFDGPVGPTGAGVVDEPPGTPARAVFEVPPGRLRLKMSIQDAASTVLDQDVRDLSVRDLTGVAIGTPEVMRARNAREFRAIDTEAAVPVVSREFSRTERLLIRFRAYGAAAPPSVEVRLLDRAGHRIRVLDAAVSASGDYTLDVPLAGFAPSDYTLEIAATQDSQQATERVAFRVTY